MTLKLKQLTWPCGWCFHHRWVPGGGTSLFVLCVTYCTCSHRVTEQRPLLFRCGRATLRPFHVSSCLLPSPLGCHEIVNYGLEYSSPVCLSWYTMLNSTPASMPEHEVTSASSKQGMRHQGLVGPLGNRGLCRVVGSLVDESKKQVSALWI